MDVWTCKSPWGLAQTSMSGMKVAAAPSRTSADNGNLEVRNEGGGDSSRTSVAAKGSAMEAIFGHGDVRWKGSYRM